MKTCNSQTTLCCDILNEKYYLLLRDGKCLQIIHGNDTYDDIKYDPITMSVRGLSLNYIRHINILPIKHLDEYIMVNGMSTVIIDSN